MTILDITKLSHDGRGVGRDAAGKTVFVDGALPGEQVLYTVKNSKRRYTDAIVSEVIISAAERVQAPCPHFLVCGGCAQQHISHSAQLAAKQQSMLEQLLHFGQVTPMAILPALTGPQLGYRTKARMGVRFVIKKEKVLLGFRERQKSYLADIDSCAILHPSIGTKVALLKQFIHTLDGYQEVAQLEIAVGDDHLAIIVRHMQVLTASDRTQWINLAQQHNFDLYLQGAGPESITKVWPQDEIYRLTYSLPAYNLKFNFHPTDFTQINPVLNRKMVQQALDLLQLNAQDRVLDLFCGLGNFTLPMAQLAQIVVGVEGSEAMVQRGYENAKLNGIENVSFYSADLTVDHASAIWAQQTYTKILIDPPRSGAAEVLPLIAKFGAKMIVYVSCNPATLARDSGILTQQFGYSLATVGIMDMFPHTLHVEAMALFIKD